ncbi:MAG: protein translocase subunit SecD [Nitrospinota bacterium]|jgi:preprotein translocase subunit SecD|nr:protein translocase subunit SecD [Nitrospinota bacterium]
MKSPFAWKIGLIVLVLAASLWYALPLNKTIKLGLDLQGGMHLVLEVEAEKAIEGSMERAFGEIRGRLNRKGVKYVNFSREGDILKVTLPEKRDVRKVSTLVQDFADLRMKREKGNTHLIEMAPAAKTRVKDLAVRQALETMRNRIDQFGVAEPSLIRQGNRRLVIQLPGVKDPERAKRLIGRTALLEFKLVDEQNSVDEALTGRVPPGSEILYQPIINRKTRKEERRTPFLVKRRTVLTGNSLVDARVEFGQFNQPRVSVRFDGRGSRIFDRITAANVGKRLAIVLDKRIYSAPVIQERISGGSAVISGSFTDEEARDLAIVLRAGALPAPVKILEERTVGPSLGRDSIRAGIAAIIVGGIVVLIFMVVYYGLSGFLADLALVLNLVIIMGVLAGFGATLTLPGIAGLILTVGMAVDANVLVFERIREELRLGKTIRVAVDQGYGRAFLTILDANVTTLIAALVLLQFGTGPVRGFAITLSVGILASMFTAVFVTRVVFDRILSRREVRALSI